MGCNISTDGNETQNKKNKIMGATPEPFQDLTEVDKL